MSLLRLEAIAKHYQKGGNNIHVLMDVSLDIAVRETISIVGPSGSGKSTLLNIIGLLDRPDAGSYWINGKDTRTLADIELSRLRASTFGFVFQSFNLMPKLTALQNVMFPMQFGNLPKQQWKSRAKELLEVVGLRNHLDHKPTELSGGQEQRVALARAFANAPKVILADEPTGNLDSDTGKQILELLLSFTREEGAVIIVTHDPKIAQRTSRTLRMKDGYIFEQNKAIDEAFIET
jgi:putative ABC transport system ATP-binding protein